jgi:hypothetical protein
MEFGKHAVEAMVKAIENPYKSTVKIEKFRFIYIQSVR